VDRRPILSGIEAAILGVVAVTLVVGALIGPGGGKNESRPSGTPVSPGKPETAVDVKRIERRVEKLRGLRFRKPL
jgi:hypothetical protein